MCYYKVKASVGYTGRAEVGKAEEQRRRGEKREKRNKTFKKQGPGP